MNEMPDGVSGQAAAVLHAAGVLQAHIESRLAEVGLSLPKLMALRALSQAGESLPLSQLADRLACVKSNITQLVDRLESDGFVTRAADPNDRRSRLAVMTAAGRYAFEKGSMLHDQAEREALGGLDATEVRQLAALLTKLGSHHV